MAMEDVPDISASFLFSFLFFVCEVCDFFLPTTFCRSEVRVCVFFFNDWTQPTRVNQFKVIFS